MHDTAYLHGRLFFQLYGAQKFRRVVELGSQDVNGSLRDHCPDGVHYIGLDIVSAKGVDVVVRAGQPLPLASETVDAVLASSAFEHDVCFWDTFLELIRILRPGGLLYVNAPSNGGFHRHPLDCWRFYPDAGFALVQWAGRHGADVQLVESFIGAPQAEQWADFVAVFRKAGNGSPVDGPPILGRIADHVPAFNVADPGQPPGAPMQIEAMPDIQRISRLQTDLAASQEMEARQQADLQTLGQSNGILATDLKSARDDAADLRRQLTEAICRVCDLERQLDQANNALAAIRASTTWRMTACLRRISRLIRGA